MKTQETKEKFILLRAEGYSFDSIAKKLNVSKPTLIKWSKDYEREIDNARYLFVQNLMEQYKITKQKRITFIVKELEKIYAALEKKDYNDLSIRDLISSKEKFENALNKEIENISYYTGEFESQDLQTIIESCNKKEITIDLE